MAGLTDMLAKAILDHNGEIHTGSIVQTIQTDNNRVTQIICENNRKYKADWYIGSINPYLGQTMLPDQQKLYGKMYDLDQYTVSPSAVLFYLGLKQEAVPDDWPYFVSLHTGRNPEEETRAIDQGHFDNGLHLVITTPSLLDQTLAPAGFHCLKILVHAPHASIFAKNKTDLKTLQQKVFQEITAKTKLKLQDNIVLNFSATPQTLNTRTDNEEGAMYGLDAAMHQVGPRRPPTRTRLKNLLWIGHYTRPAHGIVGSGLSGSFAANIISKK
jgi:phytoene dehydrogenase-like protein